jgi:hypothetical protein
VVAASGNETPAARSRVSWVGTGAAGNHPAKAAAPWWRRSQPNSGEEWSAENVQQCALWLTATPRTGVISLRLGRSEDAVRAKAQAEGISLAPANRPPYGDMS